MHTGLIALSLIAGLLATMLLLLELGRRFGKRRLAEDPDVARAGQGIVDGAVFSLMGLLIAFTFSGAAARFDARRAMVVQEANAIGTAWLRLDVLPASVQPPLRQGLRDYTEARLAVFQKIPDVEAASAELRKAAVLQQQIWTNAIAACREPSPIPATMLLLPALNQMFDMASTRTAGVLMHPPLIIYEVLILLVMASSLLAGYSLGMGKTRNWFRAIAFVFTIVLAVYVILDFEFPRVGLIRIHGMDSMFVELLETMKP